MADKTKREIHGYMNSGERVFLGSCTMSDAEVQSFLDNLAIIYAEPSSPGVFNVRSSVFNARAFAGVQITPLSN